MRKMFTLLFAACLGATATFAQRNCSTMEHLEHQKTEDPAVVKRMQDIENHTRNFVENQNNGTNARVSGVITIPVVVHVLYRTTQENISNAQIQSQITVLNRDFRKQNSDVANVPSLFSSLAADTEIQFVLATTAPNGSATTGITRKSTTRTSWGTNDAMKRSSQGGVDPWDATRYLNIWVCNIGGGILGYAQFPGGSTATDGVVISPQYFGSSSLGSGFYLSAPFDKGRTATHEVGHWLNLRHIWGDANCGNDFVSDTPTQQTSNGGCPSFPRSTCGNTSDMFMNYMDYTNDACMYMFSNGQKARMRATFESGGGRSGFAGGSTTPPPPPTVTYCASKGNSVADEWIQRVQVGSINNTSGANGGYGNFTSQSTNMARSRSYSITITPGWSGSVYSEAYAVWIDWNRDGDFNDSGEQVFSRSRTTASSVSGSFTVPSSAVLGATRMRVSMKYNANPTSCETFSYGEVEDYTINILAAREDITTTVNSVDNADIEVFPNPTSNGVASKVKFGANMGTVTLQVIDMRGSVVYNRVVNTSLENEQTIETKNLDKGIYLVNVTSETGLRVQKKLVIVN